MQINFVKRICKWNEERGNSKGNFNTSLELALLTEELNEFTRSDKEVDKLDALVDIIFVAIGSMHKLGLTPQQIVRAIEIVCDANDQKQANKDANGKIMKDHNFISPETKLQKLLDERE
jgi:predicted HAD superfamily Cof-like phosphohydrolase